LVDLSVEFEPGANGELVLTIRGIKISYGQLIKYQNANKEVSEIKSFTFNGKTCPAPIIDGKVKLRILGDRTSMELYANDGANVASAYEFEIPENLEIKVESKGNVKINSLIVNELMSSWK
jgi:fructan beta-fructosidase